MHGAQDMADLVAHVAKLTTEGSAMATQLSEMEAKLAISTERAETLTGEVAKLTTHGSTMATQLALAESQLSISNARTAALVAELKEKEARLVSTTEAAAAQEAAAKKESVQSFEALAETQREVAKWKEEAAEARAALGSSEVQRAELEEQLNSMYSLKQPEQEEESTME